MGEQPDLTRFTMGARPRLPLLGGVAFSWEGRLEEAADSEYRYPWTSPRRARRSTMNVSLTPELEQLIQDRVKTGRYHSASEVVREALRLLEDRDELRRLRLADLRQKVATGLESLDRGEGLDGETVFDELHAGLGAEDDRG
jgi:antitoxin ParD1/3/4